MSKINLFFLICILIGISLPAVAQKTTTTQKQITAAEQEIQQFFAAYAEDLRKQRREAIADRYDRRGTYFMGQGRKHLDSFEAVKDRYLNKWSGPKSFEWKDLSIDVLSPNVAVVLGRFEWETEAGKVLKYSYTGVLVKRDGRWRIRVEDESSAL